MDRRYLAIWMAAALLMWVPAANAEPSDPETSADKSEAVDTLRDINRLALIDSKSGTEPTGQSDGEVGRQLAELSQRIDNLIKVSQQQQKIAQYQLVALAAISVLLVVLLASGLSRRRAA